MSDAPKRKHAGGKHASGRASGRRAGGAARSHGDDRLLLAAEELSVGKRKHATARVRVATRTRQRDALVDEDLAQERVEIETVPVGRPIDAVPEVRREGDITIFPVVEEVLHVERQLVLKEEVHIRRVRTTERHQETVTLRHQEAVITRQPSGAPTDPHAAATDTASSKRPKELKKRRG